MTSKANSISWILIVFLVPITVVYGEEKTELDDYYDSTVLELNTLLDDAKMVSDRYDILREKKLTCKEAPELINVITSFAVLGIKYKIFESTTVQFYQLAKLAGLYYLVDCTTYDYHQSHNMLRLALQIQSLKADYERSYGEIGE